METMVKVKQVCPAETREYTKTDGTAGLFHSRGLVLGNGVDEIYAEVTGEQALAEPDAALTADVWRTVQLRWTTRMYTAQDGKPRYATRAEIRALSGTMYR